MCCVASVAFRSTFDGLYGTEATFELVTRIALAAKIWCPILLSIALAIFVRHVLKSPQTRTALAALFALNLALVIFVSCGFYAPFLRTIFHMSNPQFPTPKTP